MSTVHLGNGVYAGLTPRGSLALHWPDDQAGTSHSLRPMQLVRLLAWLGYVRRPP